MYGNRRQILQSSAVGFGYLALQSLLASTGYCGSPGNNPLSPKEPHFTPRAKRIVFLFMKGGPSHVDTFDPKPSLDRDDGKPPPFALPRVVFAAQGNLLKSPWKFKQHGESGLPVSELFPNVAKHIDKLCVLRSLHGSNPAHGGALLKIHTGSDLVWGLKIKISPRSSRFARLWRTEVLIIGVRHSCRRATKELRLVTRAYQLQQPR